MEFRPKPNFKYLDDYGLDDDDPVPTAFFIRGEMSPEDGPPTNGEEYLKTVRWESKRFPGIVVSDIDPRRYDDQRNKQTYIEKKRSASKLTVSQEWQDSLMAYFETLSQNLDNFQPSASWLKLPKPLPSTKDEGTWRHLCFPKEKQHKDEPMQTSVPSESSDLKENSTDDTSMNIDGEREEGQVEDGEIAEVTPEVEVAPPQPAIAEESLPHPLPPLLKVILNLDEVSTIRLFEHQCNWLEHAAFSEERSQWIFALMTRIKKPLHPDTQAAIMTLVEHITDLKLQVHLSSLSSHVPSSNKMTRWSPPSTSC
eukprot:TRINITY_DN8801_c0_g1_i2.p1 TRINITY_DN8801_c0_g1~~TRINITY_DN8801_c0_g1_i2.p1  ORF type:complete len:311 (+),score=49.92 TRINITY_DN8801_c0_g1_i2:73-1005(+)